MPSIDSALAKQGQQLYAQHCAGCHLPATTSADFWSEKHWRLIRYFTSNNEMRETDDAYLRLKTISLDDIGTDPSQAAVLETRRVDTVGLELDTEVCALVEFEINGELVKALKYVSLDDSAAGNFGLSLGAVVERTNQQWFKQNYIPKPTQDIMQGSRPNCLRPGQGYKARPLNGVWATAPFLHNGSVASIYDLLSPANERPTFVELGNPSFDPTKLGITQSETVVKRNAAAKQSIPSATKDYAANGFFILDTRQVGNRNTGHSFEGNHRGYAKNGVVRPLLSEDQRKAIIEYLKSI